MSAIDEAKRAGESLGGTFRSRRWGVPVGLGSHVHWDRRLDGQLAAAMMSIQGIKGVEVGRGFEAAFLMGSEVHDEIFYHQDRGFLDAQTMPAALKAAYPTGSPSSSEQR